MAPVPGVLDSRKSSTQSSERLYDAYLATCTGGSFLSYCRTHVVGKDGNVRQRSIVGYAKKRETLAVGVRFQFELLDLYHGQWASVFLPHGSRQAFYIEHPLIQFSRFYAGVITYLMSLDYRPDSDRQEVLADYVGIARRFVKVSDFPGELPALPMDRSTAASYYISVVTTELSCRVRPSRVLTFSYRVRALEELLSHLGTPPGAMDIPLWDLKISVGLSKPTLSSCQDAFVSHVVDLCSVADANEHDASHRMVHLCGDPGSGKTEAIIQLALRLGRNSANVLILCPTGQLVTTYRERISEDDNDTIVVETIHSGFRIARDADAKTYAPPGRLRRYDAIIVDEASQIDDHVASMFLCGFRELPQKPALVVAADYQQLRQVGHRGGKCIMEALCDNIEQFRLLANHRTNDEELKAFLTLCRTTQPDKSTLRAFFDGRLLDCSLQQAVSWSLHRGIAIGKRFTWLCVTHKGVAKVNEAALLSLKDPITQEHRDTNGYPGDPKVEAGNIVLREGLRLRLSRNVDKSRGFVNGALCTIQRVLSRNVAVVELFNGRLLLLHPIVQGEDTFLPCSYGYATTIRKAQGASLPCVILFFDHCYPPDRGYGYVGASRSQTKDGLYLFGRLRRSDWLPVGDPSDYEQLVRGSESLSDDSEEEQEDPYDSSEEFDDNEFAHELSRRYDEGELGGDDSIEQEQSWSFCELDNSMRDSSGLFDSI